MTPSTLVRIYSNRTRVQKHLISDIFMSILVRYLFAFTLPLALIGCDTSQPQQEPVQTPPAVTVASVLKTPLTESFSFLGLTKAVEEVELMARSEGFLAERRFTEGSDVRKGDILFVIDP